MRRHPSIHPSIINATTACFIAATVAATIQLDRVINTNGGTGIYRGHYDHGHANYK